MSVNNRSMSERDSRMAIASSALTASTGVNPASSTISTARIRSTISSSTTRTLGTPVGAVSNGILDSFPTFVDQRRALLFRGSRRLGAGPGGERIPFGPAHPPLFVSDFDKNERGVILTGLRSGEGGGKSAGIPDGCRVGHVVSCPRHVPSATRVDFAVAGRIAD